MAALRAASKSYVNLPVSGSHLSSGVPFAAGLKLGLKAPEDHHHHGGPRADFPAKFASSVSGASSFTRLSAPVSVQTRSMHTSTPARQRETTEIPVFSHYKAKSSAAANRNYQYFGIGAFGLMGAVAGKATVVDLLASISASADVLAMAKIEVDMNTIPEGKNVILKWRGKPVFIRHRTADEIEEANSVDLKSLRDPQADSDRVQQPEWLVMVGVCTHLGCVPIGEAGDFGGWFCPCHGSHYDISGRIRKGPAPLNLEVPEYSIDGETMTIG